MPRTTATPKPKTCTLAPYGNLVVIERLQSNGAIYVPTDSDNGPTGKGTVVAVGPGAYNNEGVRLPCDVEIGEFVTYRNGPSLVEVEHEGEKFVCIPENYLVARL